MTWEFKENSLDAIRLLAATQVAVLHTCEFMFVERTGGVFFELLRLFPGVPIFFFVSGYLISKSYESTPNIAEYAKNRGLRLYPALIICVAINLVMVWSTGYFSNLSISGLDIGILFFAKSTFIQFYNPDFMRAFGDGVLNGSLWTICVEVQFYIVAPLVYKFFGKNKAIGNLTLCVLILIFLVANRCLYFWQPEYSQEFLWKLYRVSFAPWFYMFLAGVIFQRNFAFLAGLVSKIPALLMLAGYFFIALFLTRYAGFETENAISPILFVFVILLVFRLSYVMPHKVNSLMKGNDISYGIYIWHMPIVNQMLYMNYRDSYWHVFVACTLSIFVAFLSWRLIEKPALKLKSFTLNTRVKNVDS